MELSDKNIMKKAEGSIKPQFYENIKPDMKLINDIQVRYKTDPWMISFYKKKLVYFEEVRNKKNAAKPLGSKPPSTVEMDLQNRFQRLEIWSNS